MLVKYTIHKIGTPKFAWRNHWTEYASEYWNSENGWGFKWDAEIFEDKNVNLPLDGEWVEVFINEDVEENNYEDMLERYS
jgi:hypothetical protein